MTSEQASAQICATLNSISPQDVTPEGKAAVEEWCNGTTSSGRNRPELLASAEGEALLALLLQRIRDESAYILGIYQLRGEWDALGIQALALALDSGTRLCT